MSSAGQSGAGFLLGVYGLVQVLNYAKGGMPAVRQWHRAKFLNKTDAAPAVNPQTPAPAAQPSPAPSPTAIPVPSPTQPAVTE